MDRTYTLSGALEYGKQGKIEEWVHEFLLGVGDNPTFSEGLKLQKRFYAGPVRMPLHLFKRICGPEEDMKYRNPAEGFELHVGNMVSAIREGWDMPPLIVQFGEEGLELNDGNHRFEALIRTGETHHHVIFWTSAEKDLVKLQSWLLGIEHE